MSNYCFESFISEDMRFCLLDPEGFIRATAYSLEGIVKAKEKFRWGRIFTMTFDGKVLKIGREMK